MTTNDTPQQADQTQPSGQAGQPVEALTAESLIEEVSIDGMCGVY